MKKQIKPESLESLSNRVLFLAIHGGGYGAVPLLFANKNIASSILGVVVPACSEELFSYIGPVGLTVSKHVAMLLSSMAYNRTISDFFVEDIECVGIGVTSSLAEGEHRVCLAVTIITAETRVHREYVEIVLKKKRTPAEEDAVISNLIVAMADVNMFLRKAHPLHPATLSPSIGLHTSDTVTHEIL